MISVGILGGSGYVGAELLRICAMHPEFKVVYATGDSQAGSLASSLYPSLTSAYPNLIFDEYSLEATLKCDVVFLALPHEASLEIVPQLLGKVRLVVDCSAAFRLKMHRYIPLGTASITHNQQHLSRLYMVCQSCIAQS